MRSIEVMQAPDFVRRLSYKIRWWLELPSKLDKIEEKIGANETRLNQAIRLQRDIDERLLKLQDLHKEEPKTIFRGGPIKPLSPTALAKRKEKKQVKIVEELKTSTSPYSYVSGEGTR